MAGKAGAPVQLTCTLEEWRFLVAIFKAHDAMGLGPMVSDEGKSLKAKVERIESVRALRNGA